MKVKIYTRTVETRVIHAEFDDLMKFSHNELRHYARSIGVEVGKTKEETALNLYTSGKATLLQWLETYWQQDTPTMKRLNWSRIGGERVCWPNQKGTDHDE